MAHEKGTWQPRLTGLSAGSASLAASDGQYARSGNIVHASGRIVTSSVSGLSGQLCIEGLPLVADLQPEAGGRNASPLSYWAGFSVPSGATIMGFMQDPQRIRLHFQTGTSGANKLMPSHISGQVTIYFSVTYICRDLLPFELIEWQRDDAPLFGPPGGTVWDGASIYSPNLARNLDRSIYRDANGDMYLYYIGDNTNPGDLDQMGLFKGPDFDNLTKVSVNAPVMALGTPPALDAGDVQPTTIWHDGTKFICYYQGNASAPTSGLTDNVIMCKATSLDGIVWTKHGLALGKGPIGDKEDHYWHKLIPNAPGGPRIYYTGKDAAGNFGLMCAVSNSIEGPWTRLKDTQLFTDGITVFGDAWYADGMYHFLYTPYTDDRGIVYATSEDGESIDVRSEIFTREPGRWDNRPYHAFWVQDDGVDYLVFNATADIGIGCARSPV